LNHRPLVRALLASAAIAAAIALAGCDTDGTPAVSGRHMQPLSERMLADIDAKNMEKESAILVRIFKEEAELEVWLRHSETFELVKRYPICARSGELGPKVKAGDEQAPEGFYTVTRAALNPASKYHLAFNVGYPNAYDRAHDRTGSAIMVHGDCLSIGCFAMTDEGIDEIYSLADAALTTKHPSFAVHVFPFRMTRKNLGRHADSKWMSFWLNLKEGYDRFETKRVPEESTVKHGRYVF
jgi:murein L,D-transpeptidase YafK